MATADGAFYQFQIDGKGEYSIWYNDGTDSCENLIATVTDATLTDAGIFGLYTESSNPSGSTAGFDNSVAYAPFSSENCSLNSDQSIEVGVENQFGADLVYFWVDYDCNAQYIGIPPAGETTCQ